MVIQWATRVFLAAMTSLVAVGATRIARDMPSSTSTGTVVIIVQYTTRPNSEALNQVRTSGLVKRQYLAIPAVYMTVPVAMIGRIASDPQVAYVSPNRTVPSSLDITTQSVNANQFWSSGFEGTGIGVAVIDSGVA